MKYRLRDVLLFSATAAIAVVGAILASAPKSSAIPAFSRKYQTACTTCHNNYPELNDFGEAFKKNGFKFPKDDETFVKEPPVLLGSKAQKEAFPGAVFPGDSRVPTHCVSVRGQFHIESQAARGCHRPEWIHSPYRPVRPQHLHDHQRRKLRPEPFVLD